MQITEKILIHKLDTFVDSLEFFLDCKDIDFVHSKLVLRKMKMGVVISSIIYMYALYRHVCVIIM